MKAEKRTIAYITRDIERALGTNPSDEYRIISNSTPYAEEIFQMFPSYVTLVRSDGAPLDTAGLMEHEVTLETISHFQPDLVVFKNTTHIESISKSQNWNLLNPRSALAEKIENKITQVEWLGEMAEKWLPKTHLTLAKNISWKKDHFILQWAHSHTGMGTIMVDSKKIADQLQTAFPERMARISMHINGPSFTLNGVVAPNKILVGNISYQITGIEPFTDGKFTTVGNDWSLTANILTELEIKNAKGLAKEVGEKLKRDGWKGLFGIDFIKDEERNRLFLIEINARQPASTTCESQLQEKNRKLGIPGLTTFEAHLKSLRQESIDEELIGINDGAQIVQRVTAATFTMALEKSQSLKSGGYNTVSYDNSEPNADLLRIRSDKGIMEKHNEFNRRGKEIEEIVKK